MVWKQVLNFYALAIVWQSRLHIQTVRLYTSNYLQKSGLLKIILFMKKPLQAYFKDTNKQIVF